MMRLVLYILLTILSVNFVNAQWAGYETGNFAGIHALRFQPADIANTQLKADGNIITLGLTFFEKNYQSDTEVESLLQATSGLKINKLLEVTPEHTHIKAQTILPSIIYSINNRMAVGFSIHLDARFTGTTSNSIIKKVLTNDLDDINGEEFTNEFVAGFINSYTSYGLTFSSVIISKNNHLLKGGLTAKILTGVAQAEIQIDDLSFKVEGDVLSYVSFNMHLIYDENVETVVEDDEFTLAGKLGGGLDLGLVYEYRPEKFRIDNYLGYKFKVGFSILDVGKLRYKSGENSLDFTASATNVSMESFENLQSWDELGDTLKRIFNVDENEVGDFSVKTPPTLGIQFDYYLGKNFYINLYNNVTFNKVLTTTDVGLKNNLSIQLTPRFETKKYGVYLPLSYDNTFNFNAGISLRWKAFIIGSSNIISRWFYPVEEQIGMVYLAIKVPILKKEYRDIGQVRRALKEENSNENKTLYFYY